MPLAVQCVNLAAGPATRKKVDQPDQNLCRHRQRCSIGSEMSKTLLAGKLAQIFEFLVVLVLNEMVLVLVIEGAGASITSTSTVLRTEHEHEIQGFYGMGVERCES